MNGKEDVRYSAIETKRNVPEQKKRWSEGERRECGKDGRRRKDDQGPEREGEEKTDGADEEEKARRRNVEFP